MNKNEKKYLLDKCFECYHEAMENRTSNFPMFVVYLSQARVLKQTIEKFVDCQTGEYYQKYIDIVCLENQIRGR